MRIILPMNAAKNALPRSYMLMMNEPYTGGRLALRDHSAKSRPAIALP